MKATIPTLNAPFSSAEICRRNGWPVGTRLVGDEGYGPTVIEITAIGTRSVLAMCLHPDSHDLEFYCLYRDSDRAIDLHFRDWQVVDLPVTHSPSRARLDAIALQDVKEQLVGFGPRRYPVPCRQIFHVPHFASFYYAWGGRGFHEGGLHCGQCDAVKERQ